MDCPRCQKALRSSKLKSIDVDECADCGGIWFDQDELRRAKDEADPDLDWMDFEIWKYTDRFWVQKASVSCPRCPTSMVCIDYDQTGVEIDYCIRCKGVWLDATEFQKIIQELEREAAAMDVGDYLQATLREAGELLTGPRSLASEWKDLISVLRLLQYRVFAENPRLVDTILAIQKGSPIR